MQRIFFSMLLASFFVSCKEKEDDLPNPPSGNYESGVFILNEGQFMTGTGTVDFYTRDTKELQKNVFSKVNQIPLGNVLQSATLYMDKLYFVVNNSQRVVITDANTLEQKGEITGFQSPRYMVAAPSGKAYISDWVSNSVKVVNLSNNNTLKSISCGNGPDKMLLLGQKLYVLNSGGFGTDSTLTVINTITDEVEATHVVGYNPQGIQLDALGNIWILCFGISDWNNPANNAPGNLIQIYPPNFSVLQNIPFPSVNDHPGKLEISPNRDVLYFLSNPYGGSIYKMSTGDFNLPASAFIQGSFYGLGLDPKNGDIYASDPIDYTQEGIVYRFSPAGTPIDTIDGGVIPGAFFFR